MVKDENKKGHHYVLTEEQKNTINLENTPKSLDQVAQDMHAMDSIEMFKDHPEIGMLASPSKQTEGQSKEYENVCSYPANL